MDRSPGENVELGGGRWVVERCSLWVPGGLYPDALAHLDANGPDVRRTLALTRWQADWVAEFLLPHLAPAAPVDDLPEGVDPFDTLTEAQRDAVFDRWTKMQSGSSTVANLAQSAIFLHQMLAGTADRRQVARFLLDGDYGTDETRAELKAIAAGEPERDEGEDAETGVEYGRQFEDGEVMPSPAGYVADPRWLTLNNHPVRWVQRTVTVKRSPWRPAPVVPVPDMVPWADAITGQRTHVDGWLIAGCLRDDSGLLVHSADRSITDRVDPLHGRVACAPLPKDSE